MIWVLEQGRAFEDGTAENCRNTMENAGSTAGLCVGDDETEPDADVWDESVFSVGRGFDILVERSSMEILWSTSHGTPSGNDNPDGAEILQMVRDSIADL